MSHFLRCALFFIFIFLLIGKANAEILKREGNGYLEYSNNQYILHLKGNPYERGWQHGRLLKENIQANIEEFIDVEPKEHIEKIKAFYQHLPEMMTYIPRHFMEEMKGLADGAEIAFQKIISLNLFPELFHCSGITVTNEATKNGQLYHVRVLDYAIGKQLQKSAVVMIVEPELHFTYLNVSYAGFIGSVTGMNNQKIAIGEIGGKGYGYWNGIPMAFLLREILEKTTTLEEAKRILQSNPRTCEYYYVISDGKTNDSFGAYATESQLHFIRPGDDYAFLTPQNLPKNYGEDGLNDKFFLSPYKLTASTYQIAVSQDDGRLIALFHKQPKDCLVITGYSYPERYPIIIDRLLTGYGQLDEHLLKQVIRRPCSRNSNLHNAIFLPAELKAWVAQANAENEPACEQPYILYELYSRLNPN